MDIFVERNLSGSRMCYLQESIRDHASGWGRLSCTRRLVPIGRRALQLISRPLGSPTQADGLPFSVDVTTTIVGLKSSNSVGFDLSLTRSVEPLNLGFAIAVNLGSSRFCSRVEFHLFEVYETISRLCPEISFRPSITSSDEPTRCKRCDLPSRVGGNPGADPLERQT